MYVLSILGYSLLALVIYRNKSLQVHPMNLIYYITIVDSILLFDVFASFKVCSWHIYELFTKTVLFSNEPARQLDAIWYTGASKNLIATSLSYLSILLNTCLAIDLILMIKYPFVVKEKRVPLYLVGSILIAVFVTVNWFLSLKFKAFPDGNMYPVPSYFAAGCCLLIDLSYVFGSIASIVYAVFKLCRSGISNETRKLVLLRHVVSIVGFMLSQVYFLMDFLVVTGQQENVPTIYITVAVIFFSA